MLLHLISLAALAPQPTTQSLLAAVPDDAYALLHCHDVGAFRERLERNDWYRLLGSPQGEFWLSDLATGFGAATVQAAS